MREASFELLWVIPLLPVAAALLLFPMSRRLPRAFLSGLSLLAWLGSAVGVGLAFEQQLALGGWAGISTGPFAGARLIAHDPTGTLRLLADPLGLLFAAAFALAGFLALTASATAFGGGPRIAARPLSAGQLLGLLLLYGLAQGAALAPNLAVLVAACSLASLVGWALLSSTDPKREQRDAAGQVFILHRVGDAAWVLALALLVSTFKTSDASALVRAAVGLESWTRLTSGPYEGFPASSLFSTTALLVILGVASRVPLLPLPMLYRHASGLPAPALSLVHGSGALGLGVLVLLRTLPVWERGGWVPQSALWLAAGAALVAALAAALTRDILRADLHLLHAAAALAVTAALTLQLPAATLLALTVVVLAPCLLSATGAVLEALPGQHDMFEMGGLWRSLKVTDRARAFATLSLTTLPPLATWLALERTVFEALDGPARQPVAALLLLATALAMSFAGFRALHLVYSGDAPRLNAPANLVEVPLWRSLGPLLVSFAALALPAVLALPSVVGGELVAGHQEPFQRFLQPLWASLSNERMTDESTRALLRQGLSPTWRIVGMASLAAIGALGYALSAVLYRKGPTRLHQRLSSSAAVGRSAALIASTLGLERVFLVWLPAVVLQAARIFTAIVLSVLLEGVVTRAVAFVGTLLRALIRVLHNGDVQRALFFAVLTVALLLFAWGRA